MFKLPEEAINRFFHKWKLAQELLLQHPGFIDATLHHNLHKEETRFRFINVAHCESEAHLKAGTYAIHVAEATGTVPC